MRSRKKIYWDAYERETATWEWIGNLVGLVLVVGGWGGATLLWLMGKI